MQQMLCQRSGWIALVVCGLLALTACGGNDDAGDRQPKRQAEHESTPSALSSNTQSAPQKPLVSGLPDFSRLVRRVSPAVVNISATPPRQDRNKEPGEADHGDDGALGDWLRRFFGNPPAGDDGVPLPKRPEDSEHVSLGSGFIISSDGYVLTNRHVIKGAGQIVVKLNDRRQLVARLVGADPDSDVAVLKMHAKHLPTVRIGHPEKLNVGAWVVAIGSPFGFETSVTAGIVSAKGRSLAREQYVPFLQTDVAINPGNSGGPLFDLAGEVVGINSQIYSQTGGYQGVSFAIPIDIAMRVAGQLRDTGHVTRGWLGVQIQNVDRELAKSFELRRPEGALITRVLSDSPAARAGLRVGDVILAFNGHPVDSASDLPPLVASVAPGKKAPVKILRDGDVRSDTITIAVLPARLQGNRRGAGPGSGRPPKRPDFGLSVEALSAAQRHKLGLDQGGVRVTGVAPGPAAEAGLRSGDIILSVGSADIADRRSLLEALHKVGGTIALLVVRDGVRRYLPMQTNPGDNGG